jgi:hypothetical protein
MKTFVAVVALMISPMAFADDAGTKSAAILVTASATDAGTVALTATLPDGGVITAETAPKVVSEESDPSDLAMRAVKAAKSRDWKLLIALVVSILAWGARKYGKSYVPFLGTDRGGIITVFALAFVGCIANVMIALGSGGLASDIWLDAVSIAMLSIGGYTGLKKLFFPADAKASPEPAKG